MRDKCITIDAKVEVIKLAWDKYLHFWSQKAVFFSDEGMKLILSQIRNVKDEIISFVLKSYIRQCKKRHALAFLEWRIHFSQSRRENEAECQLSTKEIEKIIFDRVAYAERESAALLETFDLNDETVILGNFCSVIKPKSNYKLGSGNESYLIHSFESLGWPDPFPVSILSEKKFKKPSPSNAEIKAFK